MSSGATSSTALDYVRKHPGLVASTGLGGWLLLRVWFISHWNSEVALGILSNSSIPRFALGVFVDLIPAFAGAFFGLTVSNLVANLIFDTRGGSRLEFDFILFLAAVVFVSSTIPWGSALFLFLLGGALALFSWNRHKRGKEKAAMTGSGAWALIFLSFLTLAVFRNDVWLPSERVVVSGTTYFGYVLNDEGTWTTLLEEESRSLLITPSTTVTERSVCSLEDAPQPPLVALAPLGESSSPDLCLLNGA